MCLSPMRKYLNKHMKCCLQKRSVRLYLKSTPDHADLDSYAPPKVDKIMSEFLGKMPAQRTWHWVGQDPISSSSLHSPSHFCQATSDKRWARRWPRHDSTRIRGVSTVTVHKVHDWKCLKILETTDPSWASLDLMVSFNHAETHYFSQGEARGRRKHPPFLSGKRGKDLAPFQGGSPAKYGGWQDKSFLYNTQTHQNRSSRGRRYINT